MDLKACAKSTALPHALVRTIYVLVCRRCRLLGSCVCALLVSCSGITVAVCRLALVVLAGVLVKLYVSNSIDIVMSRLLEILDRSPQVEVALSHC